MQELGDNEIEEQAVAVSAVLANLPDLVSRLERACPWLAEVRLISAGGHREAVGSLVVGYARGPDHLRAAIEEWQAFTQPMRPWS